MMLIKLGEDREQMAFQNQEYSLPYKTETIKKKDQVKVLEEELRRVKKNFLLEKER